MKGVWEYERCVRVWDHENCESLERCVCEYESTRPWEVRESMRAREYEIMRPCEVYESMRVIEWEVCEVWGNRDKESTTASTADAETRKELQFNLSRDGDF